jgi:outer membrane protein TolC
VPALAVATEADARPSASTTLAVIRAHARVVRAESMLAFAQSPLGSSAAIGASIQRDMEDRDWLGGTLEFSAPLFRREHELAAIRAEVAAERAELAEAERMAALEARELELEAETARRAIEHARTAARAAADARAAIARATEEGEASRVELVEADAEIARAQAMEASQRIGLAGVVARIESRTAMPDTAGVTEGVAP